MLCKAPSPYKKYQYQNSLESNLTTELPDVLERSKLLYYKVLGRDMIFFNKPEERRKQNNEENITCMLLNLLNHKTDGLGGRKGEKAGIYNN